MKSSPNHCLHGRIIVPALLCCLLSACRDEAPPAMLGYAEAEPVRVAAPYAGRLITLSVQRGQKVAAGAPLFELDRDLEAPALREAEARATQSKSQEADLASGKRSDEMAVFQARTEAARAALQLAQSELARQEKLAASGYISPLALDSLRERARSAGAQLRQAEADQRSAALAGRDDLRRAARAASQAAEAQRVQAAVRLAQKTMTAPLAGQVEDTHYRVGEWVPAGSPIVSLLPPQGIKIRFFVPQARLDRIRPGSSVQVTCDGCGEAVPATVTRIASEAEFTPPLIYSKDNRAKLVFLAEAVTTPPDRLRPGQPVEVSAEARP